MNYRNEISDQIPSLESVFIDYLKADSLYHSQNKIPSNRITAYYLLFDEPISNTQTDEMQLLATSVFSDSFISELSNTDLSNDKSYSSPLLYYVMHLNEPFPTNSKYSQFLSNMFQKNFTGKAQPPQVRTILNAIDSDKLSRHIEKMIKRQLLNTPTDFFEQKLDKYIENIIHTERKLTEISGLTGLESTADCLAWILLYALFDDASFENYCKEHKIQSKDIHTESTSTEKTTSNAAPENSNEVFFFSKECWNSIFWTRFSIYCLIALIVLQLVSFVIILAYSNQNNIPASNFQVICIIMLLASVCLFVLRYIPYYFAQRAADTKIRLNNLENNTVSSLLRTEANRFSGINHNMRKNKGRNYLFMAMVILWVGLFILSLIFVNLTIFLSGIVLVYICYILLDHIINSKINNQDYAMLFGEDEKLKKYHNHQKASYGLALRYAWDYDFENDCFKHTNVTNLNNHSVDCIRYIFYHHAERQNYLWTSYTIFSLLLDLVVLCLVAVQYFLPDNSYFQFSNHTSFMIFTIVWVFISDFIFIVLLLRTEYHYEELAEFSNYNNSNFTDAFLRKTFHTAYNTGRISNIDVSRGIHLYSWYCYDNNIPSGDIHIVDDRPIVTHRHYDAKERYTIVYIFFTLFYLSSVVYNLHFTMGLIALPILAIAYPIIMLKLVPWIDDCYVRHLIKKYIK